MEKTELPSAADSVKAKVVQQVKSGDESSNSQARVNDLQQQISEALSSGNYFPPKSGNALDLIKELVKLSPNDSLGKEKLGLLQRDIATRLRDKIKVKTSTVAESWSASFRFISGTTKSRI
jgi:hypothetical protein